MVIKQSVTLGAAALLFLALSQPAYAYLDPGTGSMILQALLGGAAGVLIAGRLYWSNIKGIFRPEPRGQVGDEN